jgi:hypothetical protein
MYSSLYYPFTSPEDESFLKTALFLWDSVDFIVPYREFALHGDTRDANEALELVGRPYVPTETDKRAAHDELEDFCTGAVSNRLAFELERPDLAYRFYPEKLLPETWRMLADSQLARVVRAADNISQASTGPLFGHYMMSILAVCCANGRKPLVTDQNDPYRTLANVLVDSTAHSTHPAGSWHSRLISMNLGGPDFATTTLRSLISLRKREDKLLMELRQTFVRAVNATASEICEHADNPNIVSELVSDFTSKMEKDLAELKRGLGRSAGSFLLSKEVGVSVLGATAALAVEPISGTVLTIGGLIKGLIDYQDRRRKILREHQSSWLLQACGPKVPPF